MFTVYWTEVHEKGGIDPHLVKTPCSKEFDSDKMLDAMALMESLRKRKYTGENISFICMSSENPDQVGKMGVDVVSKDYNWTKRRHNERKQEP